MESHGEMAENLRVTVMQKTLLIGVTHPFITSRGPPVVLDVYTLVS